MANEAKVALITGGAAGMGYAVASRLADDGWKIVIVDLNENLGASAVESLGSMAIFIAADVTKYWDQAAAFEKAFATHNRIDFVFANAGISGNADFYNETQTWAPEPPATLVEEVCLKGMIFTSYLAMHYMRRNKPKGGVIISTASGKSRKPLALITLTWSLVQTAASIYASPDLPLYTAAKHGVLGLMRSMSEELQRENIRVNSILPGAIRTTLHSESTWDQFPSGDFTPIEEVVNTVVGMVNDDSTGKAMEISAGKTYNRTQPEFADDTMRRIMTGKSYKEG